MTWAPGEPVMINDRLIADGGWIPPTGLPRVQPVPAADHRADRRRRRPLARSRRAALRRRRRRTSSTGCAHRVQRPHEKINHALVLGGKQGIGKDTLLEPVKHAVGPWNFIEVSPQQVLGRFNGFLKSVILRVSEARDLGDFDRFAFYDHMKSITAAPPDVLRIDEKNRARIRHPQRLRRRHHDQPQDRRHLPAGRRSPPFRRLVRPRQERFHSRYWNELWDWYENGGYQVVAHYLLNLDLAAFNPKAPPPQTDAFYEIVNASRSPEDAEMADALDALRRSDGLADWPDAVTIADIVAATSQQDFIDYLKDRKNSRRIPHRFEACGYTPVRNPDAEDGLWASRDASGHLRPQQPQPSGPPRGGEEALTRQRCR